MVGKPPPLILVKSLQDTVSLNCTAAGSPSPTMHWEKNGINIPRSEVKVKGINLVKSELVLKHFAPNQSDVYTCVAKNTLSRNINEKTKVGKFFKTILACSVVRFHYIYIIIIIFNNQKYV